jgi:Zinc carboxypeptidase
MLRRIPRTAVTAALITALLGAPVLAGPVARNDQEYALLGRVFPEVADSLTYIQFTDEFVPAIHYLESRYPSRLKVFTYGTSVEGRSLYAVELTDENSSVPYLERKMIPIDISLHASERSPAEGALRFIEDVASTSDPELLALLRTTVVLFTFPNPDGWSVMEPLGLQSGTRTNANGFDLNRQFPSIGYVRSAWGTMTQPEAIATHALYERPEYKAGAWGHSVHCFTLFPFSYVQLLINAAENDLAENVQTLQFTEQVVERTAQATAGLEFTTNDWVPVMYGTVFETRRRTNTGYMGGYLAHPPPAGHNKLGVTWEGYGCENATWSQDIQTYHVEAVRAALRVMMESANRPTPNVTLQLPGLVGYLTDGAVVRHDDANGAGYVPADEFEASFEQLPYAATRMRFFEDLSRYTNPRLVPVRGTSRGFRSSIPFYALIISERATGLDAASLRKFVEAGGIVIVLDGAARLLPNLTSIPSSAIVRQTSDPGTDVPRMTEASRDFTHPLLAGLDKPQAYAEQLYEPVPVGFSLDEGAPPWWGVDETAFEAAGGRVAALDQRGTVMLGDIPVGAGRIVVIGGLLPQPTEDYFHPYGLANYAVTHVGYQVLINALGGQLDVSE